MILEIDAGNTRIKWRLLRVERDGVITTLENDFFVTNEGMTGALEGFDSQLSELPLSEVSRIKVANVRGISFAEFIASLLIKRGAVPPEFAISAHSCAGVENGYGDPGKLGVDRWLAILAAYDGCKRACFVLDCGTTTTLDIVASNGRHLGGYIVPGIALMRDMLFRRSAALAGANLVSMQLQPGINTSAAIGNGLIAMTTGFIRQIKDSQLQAESSPVWFVSGGDGELVQQFLTWESKYVPTLVLDGLRLVLP